MQEQLPRGTKPNAVIRLIMLGFAGSAQPTYLITVLLKITRVLAAKNRLSQSRQARKVLFNKALTVINEYES